MWCVDTLTERGEGAKIGVANPTLSLEALVDADLDTLVTALYVKIDDMLVKDRPPGHPVRLSQSELVCLAAAQALLGFHSEHGGSDSPCATCAAAFLTCPISLGTTSGFAPRCRWSSR